MFGRKKQDSSRGANSLSDETAPNVLAAEASERANGDPLADPETLYGTNGEAVADLIEALENIGPYQVQAVAKSWASTRPADRQIAQMMARRLRNDRRFDAPLRAAETRIRGWLEAREPTDDREASQYEEVADAARDAVAALILGEELNDADFATLYGSWSEVMDEDTEADDGEPATGQAVATEEEPGTSEQTDAEQDFGPNATLIVELLAQLQHLSPEQLRRLSGAWGSADQDALAQAHAALEGAFEADPDSRDEVERAQARVAEWAGERDVKLRGDAAPAATDAVAALAMVDALSDADADTLYAPWADAVGTPELPSLDDEP
jgi:HPt (histidine-containing phosphotransfer) domain-containing protein